MQLFCLNVRCELLKHSKAALEDALRCGELAQVEVHLPDQVVGHYGHVERAGDDAEQCLGLLHALQGAGGVAALRVQRREFNVTTPIMLAKSYAQYS